MSYQVLARKWRPKHFGEMVGQEHVVRALRNALDADRMHHAFLFTGTRGVGKTTVARILAKCLNCETGVTSTPCGECASCREIDEGRFVDLLEVDAASRSKVDETRELMDNVQFAPTRGRFKVYLIDEVHMFSDKSFNALLKTLEEPPPHVKFLLATTDPQKLPITVLSRCLQFNLKRLPADQIAGHLEEILQDEGIEASREAVRMIAVAADGSMRDALSLLDQAIAFSGGKLESPEVRAMLGAFESGHVFGVLDAIADRDARGVMSAVEQIAGEVADFGDALAEVLSVLQKVALVQTIPDALDDAPDMDRLKQLGSKLAAEDVQLLYQIGLIGRRDLPLAPDARTGFEMTMLRMLAFQPAVEKDTPRGVPEPSAGARAGSGRNPARKSRLGAKPEPASSLRTGSPPPAPDEWPELAERLPVNGLARELAANCTLKEATPNRIRLALAPARGQLLTAGVQQKLENALRKLYGENLTLKIEIEKASGDTPASIRKRKDETRLARAVEAIRSDAVVQDLCKTFGTEVDPDLVQPVSEAPIETDSHTRMKT
ncbi:MAG: DNA polymerase III subunit gamma/tau [Gammaproteobacteria bacterium]|nr:DNA polymerase III subunit gamma/tau [Gammaproteobacteria bacterium]